MFARQAAHAFAFVAHHPCRAVGQVAVIEVGIAAHVGADDPDAVFFQLAQGSGEVGYGDVGDGFRRAAGDFADGGVQSRAFVFRRDDGVYAHCVGGTQARTEVVRVSDAVKYQQQRRFAQVFQYVFEVDVVFGGVDEPDYALMPCAFADGVEAVGVGEVYAHVFVCRFLQHVARAGIIFAFLDVEFGNRFRVLPQAGVDGVEAVDESLVCHDFAL